MTTSQESVVCPDCGDVVELDFYLSTPPLREVETFRMDLEVSGTDHDCAGPRGPRGGGEEAAA